MEEYTTLVRLRLHEAGYPESQGLVETLNRLASLKGDSKQMLDKWLKDDEPVDFAPIEGVGPSLLRDKLHMKEPAIIIAYAMLQIDAIKYANTFKEWANNRKSFIPRLHI